MNKRCCFLVGMAAASLSVNAAETSLTIGTMPSYSTGDYGTGSNTNILYVPFFAKYQQDNISLKLTIPILSVTSDGNTVISGGTAMGRKRGMTTAPTSSVTQQGLGDVWVEGRYRFAGTGSAPDVTPYLKIKFGTASASKGLGTGEKDYEPGVSLEWTVGEKYFPFVDVGYRFVGSPSGSSFNNILTYDAGAMYQQNDKHFYTGMISGQQATQSGDAAPLDILVMWSYKQTEITTIQVFVDKGLSDGSPAWMVGAGFQRRIR